MPPRSVFRATRLAATLCTVIGMVCAATAAEPTTFDGGHSIARIDLRVVYFVPADRTPLVDWHDRVAMLCQRIAAFHARELAGHSTLVPAIDPEPFISRRSTAEVRAGDANATFFRTLEEVDGRLGFGRRPEGGFPILLVLSDVNWRPLDDFSRQVPLAGGWKHDGAIDPAGIHVPGAAAGGSRAVYLADRGKGWGLVSGDGWRVPCRGSDCVVYHEGVGHAIGLPHPEPGDDSVMGQAQYTLPLNRSWIETRQKRQLGIDPGTPPPPATFFDIFAAAPEPAVPQPGAEVAIVLDLPEEERLERVEVAYQTALRGPWIDLPVPDPTVRRIPLPRFDRPTGVAYRVRATRAAAAGRPAETASAWGYLQVRSDPDTPPPPHDVDPTDRLPPASPAQAGDVVDLLPLVDPDRDAVSGAWLLQPLEPDGPPRLVSPKAFGARLEVPLTPPESYRLTVIAEPLDEPDGLILGQRSGPHRFLVLLGFSPEATQLSALENVDGGNVMTNPTRHEGPIFVRHRPAAIVVDVLPDRVRVAVDGREVIDWRGDRSRLSLSDYWQTRRDDVLFVGSYDCRFRFSRLSLEPLSRGD